MPIKIGAQLEDIESLKNLLEEKDIEYSSSLQKNDVKLGDGRRLVTNQDWGTIFLTLAVSKSLDLIIQWVKNRVSNKSTNPKIIKVDEKGEEKESITLNQLDLDERQVRAFLESEVDKQS